VTKLEERLIIDARLSYTLTAFVHTVTLVFNFPTPLAGWCVLLFLVFMAVYNMVSSTVLDRDGGQVCNWRYDYSPCWKAARSRSMPQLFYLLSLK
jgi:hypothetical protein